MRKAPLSLVLIAAATVVLWSSVAETNPQSPMKETDKAPEKLSDTESLSMEEWKERLSPGQFHILRNAGTEAPNGPVYEQFRKQGEGAYHCAGCGARLFSSGEKFDSHCGWPSFWDPAEIDSVETRPDHSLGRVRTEVVCANCKGHLGHLFEGEGFNTPTDQRYCINGSVLVFVPDPSSPSGKP